MLKRKLLASLFITTGMAAAMSGVALAQAVDSEQSADEPAKSEDRDFRLQEVTVTATRREESLQNVAVAVTAVDNFVLELNQVTNIVDVGAVAPNTTIARNPSSSSTSMIYIRGIGNDSSSLVTETPISQYLDNVYVGRNVGALFDLIGIDRLEILRGPQGTLYGRNSTGGAIKIVTSRPEIGSFSASGDYTIGSFDRRDLRAKINIPLTDNMAANFSAGSFVDDGYYTNISTGGRLNRKNVQAMRAGLLWNATDRLSFYLSGDYTHDNSGLQVPTQMSGSTGAAKDVPLYGDIFYANPNMNDRSTVDTYGVALQTNYELDKGMLELTTAFRAMDFFANYDYGGAPIGPDLLRNSDQTQFSQEIQFSSNLGGNFEFVSGLFYFNEEGSGIEDFIISPALTLGYALDVKSRSVAAYAEGTYELNDRLRLIAGGRVTRDDKEVKRLGLLAGAEGEENWTKFTPKAGFQADLTSDMMAYATYSKGYKSGVYLIFPGNAAQAVTPLPPEEVDAYEIGLKADWFDGRVRTNIAAFFNKYKDLQIGVLGDSAGVQTVSADEEAKGIEIEVTARPTENLYLYGHATIMENEFTRVPTGSASYPIVGDMQRLSPEASFKLGGQYTFPFQNGSEVTVGASYSWFDEQAQGFPNSLYMMDAYDLVDARIAYTPAGESWGIELLGKNLGDTEYWTYQSYLAGYARYYNPGQTWALRLKFGM